MKSEQTQIKSDRGIFFWRNPIKSGVCRFIDGLQAKQSTEQKAHYRPLTLPRRESKKAMKRNKMKMKK